MSGVVALIFSFFDFYTFADTGANVWSSGLFPLAALMVIFVMIMAAQVALTRLAHMEISSRPFGFTWVQIHLVLAFFATVNAVAFLLNDRGFGTTFGIGFWGILVSCVAALVGAVLLQRERTGGGSGY
ncbi:MAG TPA: hypothetical protein VFZ17_12455 [Acidimicrobiia bacterium]|nr:hypothetical protein [Acidimicrobiia bacterium]